MQEQISQTTQQRCFCETLNILCKHSLRICECTYCRVKAAPRRFTSAYGRTTASQLAAITKLASIKQRSLPANIRTWSVGFASKYLKFLYELPFPKEFLPRLEQFEKEHTEAIDLFKATHKARPTEFVWADGMTKPITQSITDGDSKDLSEGIASEVRND